MSIMPIKKCLVKLDHYNMFKMHKIMQPKDPAERKQLMKEHMEMEKAKKDSNPIFGKDGLSGVLVDEIQSTLKLI